MIYYTGIGSRETPAHILYELTRIGMRLAAKGFTLRSGGADGADTAFEKGCDLVKGLKEICLPWKGFNHNQSKHYSINTEAIQLAKYVNPNWERMTDAVKKLMSRNAHQIIGPCGNDTNPSHFVICYTPPDRGGTLCAIKIANLKKIPIFNLYGKHINLGVSLTEFLKSIGVNWCETQTRVIRVKDYTNDDFTLIDRSTEFGNKYIEGIDGDRITVINKFRNWVLSGGISIDNILSLKNKILGCHCKPQPCHGDILVDIIECLSSISKTDYE